MSRRRSFLITLALLVSAAPAAAQEPATGSVQAPLAPTSASGPSGIVLVSASEPGTAIQVMAPGAAVGTTAVVRSGTCAAPGSLTGLIGQLSEAGQAQSVVPLPLASIADGAHVVTLHAGLDMAAALACGPIPATAGAGPVPEPPASAQPAVLPSPLVDHACDGASAWLLAATDWLDRMARLEDDADAAGAAMDAGWIMQVISANVAAASGILGEMQAATVPEVASELHRRLADAVAEDVSAGTTLLAAIERGDTADYQRALGMARNAASTMAEVRASVATLSGRCGDGS